MTLREIEGLKILLCRMQEEDPDFRVFGARKYHYRLGPTLTESKILAFEQKHEVRLPDDYRTFLKEAGNGGLGPDSQLFMGKSGAGPFYGLLTLEDAAQDSSLNQPFPFTESTEVLSEEAVEAVIDPDKFPGVPGALALCHRGSGLVYFLVVNGPAYGTIWEGREHFYPMAPSFDAWYGEWVRRLTEYAPPRLANERKIKDVHVGMTQAEVIALCGGEWKLTPHWGNKTHLRFTHLSTVFEIEEEVVTRIIVQNI